MKNNDGKKFFPFLFLSLAFVAAAFAVLILSRLLAGGTFSGGFIAAVILTAGLAALLFCVRSLLARLSFLETLIRPLSEGNFTALADSPVPSAGKSGQAYAPLAGSLKALGKFLEGLASYISASRAIRNTLKNESGEREAILGHTEKTIDSMTNQFFEIETAAKAALNVLDGIEEHSRSGSGEKEVPEEAASRLYEAAEKSSAVAGRIHESAGKAGELQDEINSGEDQSRQVNDIVKDIGREVEKIAEMLTLINKIAEQTNILSLNAAIESAHAGQAGAGFAVVADEIRKLAESTRENADRINEELSEINGKAREALKASGTSFETFNAVSGKMAGLAEALNGIYQDAVESGECIRGAASPEDGAGTGAREADLQESAGEDLRESRQNYKSELEQILALTGTTRTEIKEIHSGFKEILEKIRDTQDLFLSNLEETGNLEKALPGLPVNRPALPPEPSILYSDSKEVAVKKPPLTLL
jgi:methyl-accepting chemotaxis protein